MSLASCDTTVGTPLTYGTAWVTWAIQEMPAIRHATMLPWVTRICRACLPSGGRSALTALDTASIPVSDEPPFANARPRKKMAANVHRLFQCPIATVPECHGTCPRPPPNASLARPTMIITPTEPENR